MVQISADIIICLAVCAVNPDYILHTARAPNLRHDLITAKFSSVIPKQSDWSIMISLSEEGNINTNNFATLI